MRVSRYKMRFYSQITKVNQMFVISFQYSAQQWVFMAIMLLRIFAPPINNTGTIRVNDAHFWIIFVSTFSLIVYNQNAG